MKKILLTILVLAVVVVSCGFGFYYTELTAYDPAEDWERIANSEYAYLTKPRGPLAESEVIPWFADYLIASKRMYGASIGEDGYAQYYRCVDCSSLSVFAEELKGGKIKAVSVEDDALLLEIGDRDHYTFNSILSWCSVDLGNDYAVLRFTAKNYEVTQTFCIEGNYRDRWQKLWYEHFEGQPQVSVHSGELWEVLLYGDEYYSEVKKRTDGGIFEWSRSAEWYVFPLPIHTFQM